MPCWLRTAVLVCILFSYVADGDEKSTTASVPSVTLIEEVTKFGYQYLVSRTPVTWQTAEAVCSRHGGHLASITSQEEEALVEQICFDVLNVTGCWIGLNDLQDEGHYVYTDGAIFNSSVYHNWYQGSWYKAWQREPNDWLTPHSQEDCVVVTQHHRGWHDEHCNHEFQFVCKLEAPPPPPPPPPSPPPAKKKHMEEVAAAQEGTDPSTDATQSVASASASPGSQQHSSSPSKDSSRHRRRQRRLNQQLLWGLIGGITGGVVMFQMLYIGAAVMRRRRRYIGGASWDTSLEAVAVLKQVEMMPPFTLEDLESRANTAREKIATGLAGGLSWFRRLFRRGYSELPA